MRIPQSFLRLSLAFALVSAAFWLGGCKKDETKPPEAPALPAQPPLEPLHDEFQEPDSVSRAESSSSPANPRYGQVENGPYTLQIQLLQSEAAANRVVAKLKAAGIPAYVAMILDPKPGLSGTYYRVRAGSFATTAAAREYGRINLTPLGRDFWVDLKGRDSEPVHPVYTPRPATAPVQPKIVEPPHTPPPASSPAPAEPAQPPAPAPAAPAAPNPPVDPAIVPKDVRGKPAVVEDTGSVQDW